MSARTPSQAIEKATSITSGYGGMCLKFVRVCFGIGSKYGSAKTAWANAKVKHYTSSLTGIPTGAPIFFSHPKSKYGHVTVYLGNGYMRTTNSATGRIHTDPVSKWLGWGYTLLGWTEDLNGVTIPGLKKKATPVAVAGPATLRKGTTSSAVGSLQRGMNKAFPAYSKLSADNVFGGRTEAVVMEFQRREGITRDGIVGPTTRAHLARYGVSF